MKKYIQFRSIFSVFIFGSLSACQSQFVTTPNLPTEANLVANSVNNGLETELNIDYIIAFKNLKMAYGQCVAFTGEHEFVFTDNKFTFILKCSSII